MRLKQTPVSIAPDVRPADAEALIAEEIMHHGDVDIIEIDLVVAQSAAGVGAPVVPEVSDDAGAQEVGGFEEGSWGGVDDGAVGEGDGSSLGETGGKGGTDGSRRE